MLIMCRKIIETIDKNGKASRKDEIVYGAVVVTSKGMYLVDTQDQEVMLSMDEDSVRNLFTSLAGKFYLPELETERARVLELGNRVKELEDDVFKLVVGTTVEEENSES